MEKNIILMEFFSDDERYADLINGISCSGAQVVSKEDLTECDTQLLAGRLPAFIKRSRWLKNGRYIRTRDVARKVALGINFMVIGVENQEEIDYAMPLRQMSADVGTYERQASKIRREVRKNTEGLSAGEYMYGFRKDSRLHPVVTIILYYGEKEWDGPRNLHDMIDFTDIPDGLRNMVSNYDFHLVEVRKMKDTNVFQTDLKQVFDFIRYSDDKKKLRELVKQEPAYQRMEEDAFDVIAAYTNADELIEIKDDCIEGGKVNMCRGLTEMLQDEREDGKTEGKATAVLELLMEIGTISPELKAEIERQKDMEVLSIWLKAAAKSATIEEFEEKIRMN